MNRILVPRAATAVTIAILAASLGVLPAVRAADSSDIPGVPLPGPIVTGIAGGPVYDVVYQLDVPAGHVIVASLQGSPGTDFDLYLFDSTATTVVSNQGVVARSTGPDSGEAISHPTRTGGRFYIDINGATDVVGSFTLTVQAVADGTPPSVTVRLEEGRSAVNRTDLLVQLGATDDLSGVAEMAFSTDGLVFSPWQPFAPTSHVNVPAGDGLKRVWAKVRNGVGLESAAQTATITLDTAPPTVLSVTPTPGGRVTGLRPTFTVGFTEEITPASWTDLGLVVQSASGALVKGTYAVDQARRAGTFVPAADLVAGQAYVVTIGRVRDVAGNIVVGSGSWTVTPLLSASVTLAATPSVIRLGEAVTLVGTYSGPESVPALRMERRPAAGGEFDVFAEPALSSGGAVRLSVRPVANTRYRFVSAGNTQVSDTAAEVRVLVRRSVRLVGVGAGITRVVKVGAPVQLTAAIDPGAAGVSVSFRLYRFDSARKVYRYAGSWGRATDPEGRASYAWQPSSPGAYYWRISVASTPELANNVSPAYRWSVTR